MKSVINELSSRLRSGEITSRELTEKYISAVEKKNVALNAFVHTTFDEARKNAAYADALIRDGKGNALTGIPMTLKDNICTDGILTTCCSEILENFRPCYDAAVWEKLKNNGAVLLGKTNMDEFAMGSTSETSYYGAPKNPLDETRVAGGSSGGGAAAVGAEIAAYAIGSDTGGSVRQPAAFCGVVGFKPTYGTVSRYGLIAYGSSLDQLGTLTSSVTDAALIFQAIRGADERDMTCSTRNMPQITLDDDVRGLKIGICGEFYKGLGSEVKNAVESALKRYEDAGAELTEIKIPSLEYALPVYYIIACAEASSNLGRYDGIRYGHRARTYSDVEDMIVKTRSEGFGKEVKKRIMLGTYVLSSGYFDAYYKKACILRERMKTEFSKAFVECDVLAAPTVPRGAFPLGYSGGNVVETYLSDICTVPANIAGLPAVSVPCGVDKDGLPLGLQFIGDRFKDGAVLSASYFAEASGICDIYGGVR